MKKFFTEIVASFRGVKPADNAKPEAVVQQLADAMQSPFEKLGDEMETQINQRVETAVSSAPVTAAINTAVTAAVTTAVTAAVKPVTFTEGDNKTALDAAVKMAVDIAVAEHKTKIEGLEASLVQLQGKPTNTGAGAGTPAAVTVGQFNK